MAASWEQQEEEGHAAPATKKARNVATGDKEPEFLGEPSPLSRPRRPGTWSLPSILLLTAVPPGRDDFMVVLQLVPVLTARLASAVCRPPFARLPPWKRRVNAVLNAVNRRTPFRTMEASLN
ncbi:uncharacterized protein [Aegilops tauschii subsp. strangulata]|uniref:uncharacterized protein n=1 Tax=Aegilops tauschii subsp. strangulata TaxID=200361 RepID=UPI001D012F38|nr:uncharacterized protein LOC123078248 isoform X3 [Triticum aestivum]